MQPRLLSRAAWKLCRKHAWNDRSKQSHVPNTKQILLWKGWVLEQQLNDVQSRVGTVATRAHAESPLRTELFVDSCSVRHQGNCCASTREIPATWISICTQGTERCSCDKTAALARHKHTWISLRAQKDMFRRKLLRSHATSTLGSLSVRKKTCSGKTTAAFSRREHTWISLREQRDMFHRKDCCDLALPPKIDDFCLRTPDPVSTVKRAHVHYAIGNPTRNPGHRAFALQIVDPASAYAVGE